MLHGPKTWRNWGWGGVGCGGAGLAAATVLGAGLKARRGQSLLACWAAAQLHQALHFPTASLRAWPGAELGSGLL